MLPHFTPTELKRNKKIHFYKHLNPNGFDMKSRSKLL